MVIWWSAYMPALPIRVRILPTSKSITDRFYYEKAKINHCKRNKYFKIWLIEANVLPVGGADFHRLPSLQLFRLSW